MTIPFLAIILAAFVSFVIGAFWYSPLLFVKPWLALSGISVKDEKKNQKQGMFFYYIAGFFTYLVMAFVLSFIVELALAFFDGYTSAAVIGASTGFLVWLGFVATITFGSVLWEQKSIWLFILNNGYHLISFVSMGTILAVL